MTHSIYGVKPLSPEDIHTLYQRSLLQPDSQEADSIACLERAICALEKEKETKGSFRSSYLLDNSSNGARCLYDLLGRPLFVFKETQLFESFGVPKQEGAKREQMAYLFDTIFKIQANVPPTFFVDFSSLGLEGFSVGSLQRYITNAEDRDFNMAARCNKEQLRKIATLHLMILNVDPQVIGQSYPKSSNIFCIDNGYCLPSKLTFKPKGLSYGSYVQGSLTDKERECILSISPKQIETLLRDHQIDEEAIFFQQRFFSVLQIGAEQGADLGDLVNLFYEGDVSRPLSRYEMDFRTINFSPFFRTLMDEKDESARKLKLAQFLQDKKDVRTSITFAEKSLS